MSSPQIHGWDSENHDGLACVPKEMKLYGELTHRSITIHTLRFSPLEWTSISWAIGIIIAAPILSSISIRLDYGKNQQLITAAATAIGGLFCLPTGFFKTIWIFPIYITAIIACHTLAAASHTRHLGLMVRGFTGSTIDKNEFPFRRAVFSWLSLYSTAAGSLGSAIISAFTYHMLRTSNKFISLWVVSIFSGLKWIVGIFHVIASNRPGIITSDSPPKSHIFTIFKYPHAIGTLIGVFLSSYTTMGIFMGGLLFLIHQLCLKPISILHLWLTYFIFPSLSLPLLHPLQHVIKADSVRMQVLGLLLSTITSGVGFYFRKNIWNKEQVLFFAALQSTSAGLLHAFGRVSLLNCSPAGKEGVFSAWFSWMKAIGTCAGFAVASALPGNITASFGISFCTAIASIVMLIFGNISDFDGAVAAANMNDEEKDEVLEDHSLDSAIELKHEDLN